MTKSEFLSTLADGLKELPDRKLAEIIFDYQENFTTGFSNGKTEEEIIEELGNPYDLIIHYKNLYSKNEFTKSNDDYYNASEETASTNIDDTEQFPNDLSNINSNSKSNEKSEDIKKENNNSFESKDNLNNDSNNKSKKKPFQINDLNHSSTKKRFSKNFSINARGLLKLALICFLCLLCIPIILATLGFSFALFISLIGLLIAVIAGGIALNVGGISILLGKMGLVILGASNTPNFITDFPISSIIMFIIGSLSLTILFVMITYYALKFALFYTIKLIKKIFSKEAK